MWINSADMGRKRRSEITSFLDISFLCLSSLLVMGGRECDVKPLELFTLFTSKDFDRKIPLEYFGDGPKSFDFSWPYIAGTCSVLANAKFNDWLKSAVRVYGGEEGEDLDIWSHKQYPHDTHMALVVCIEELPKTECEHEPEKGTVHHEYIYDTSTNKTVSNKSYIKCAKCGIKLAPTGWKAVE